MARKTRKGNGWIWLGVGVMIGMVLAGFWPQTPLHAVATDRVETFAMATGFLDDVHEAVYVLDFLTGDLRAAALSKQKMKFNALYSYNVMADFKIDAAKSPAKFLLVTGSADLLRVGGARMSPSRSVVFVAEATTGKVAAYAIPWSQAAHAQGQTVNARMVPLDIWQFRTAAAPGAGAAAP